MKNIIVVCLLFLLPFSTAISQYNKDYESQKVLIKKNFDKKGEIYFKFNVNSKEEINNFSKIISIDNVIDRLIYFEIFAYANEREFSDFLKIKNLFEVLPHPGDNNYPTSDNIAEIRAWDTYPTYDAYINMMSQFQEYYPNLCKLYEAGTSVQGRKILFAKISDSVNFKKAKPQFCYSSSIHGDEITAYVLMLRLIDTLLTGYGTNPKITNLLKNVEIWINPLANPDGTYYGGNNTVNNARRYNYNGFDLNRNFPDPAAGPTPGGTRQPETTVFMNFASNKNFVLSMNFHGGAQVLNYPWDTWGRLHPDDDWFIRVSRKFVDTVHSINPSYLTDLLGYPNIPGITNGYAWYRITGGRQDYMTYFRGCREITFEISTTKTPAGSQLPNYWNWNFKSLLNYIQESLNGIRGIVTDSVTGIPVKAKITVVGREVATDSTFISTDSITGNYHRMINQGTYTVKFSAPNYFDKIISGVNVINDSATILDVKLRSTATGGNNISQVINGYKLYQNYPNPFNPETNFSFEIEKEGIATLKVYDISGKEVATIAKGLFKSGYHTINWNSGKLSSGIYFYRLKINNFEDTKKFILLK